MTVCIRCHRPLKQPTETGMGPVCARASRIEPVPAHERDLFGYDIDKAVHAAMYRLQVHIERIAAEASMALKASHREALARIRVVRTPREQELLDLMVQSRRLLDECCGISKGGLL
ncbi:hypothetical protein D9M73_70670 [compost metagenome]|nr:MAG TPA: hypothetical protein [Caudoviricetes sp.]